MNQKTAKHIKRLAWEEAKKNGYPFKNAYRTLKHLWITTPKTQRNTVFK